MQRIGNKGSSDGIRAASKARLGKRPLSEAVSKERSKSVAGRSVSRDRSVLGLRNVKVIYFLTIAKSRSR